MKRLLLPVALGFFASQADASCVAPPWWTADPVVRNGRTLTVQCLGEGATLELSEMEARDRCDARAILEFRSVVATKEVVVTTDYDSASHRETEDKTCVIGVVCKDPKIISCESDGVSKTWRRCVFDSSSLKEGTAKECGTASTGSNEGATSLRRRQTVPGAGKQESGTAYIATVSVTPKCTDIVVTGSNGRRVTCTGNPMRVPIQPGDEELIIRAQGYLPKTVSVERVINVYLDTH